MDKNIIKLVVSLVCFLIAGLILAWQFGAFDSDPSRSSQTQQSTAASDDDTAPNTGITLNPDKGKFVPPDPRN